MKKKILYISAVSNQISGGTSVMNRNLEMVRSVPDADVEVIQVSMQSKVMALIEAFRGGNFILSRKDEKRILEKVKKEHFDYIFQEGTSSGHLAKSLSSTDAQLVVFAHNVETMLYEDRLRSYRFNIFEAIKLLAIKRNEKKTVKYCSKLIALTERDSTNFRFRFGRESDTIIPISFESNVDSFNTSEEDGERFCLFVGSNFFPNVEGMNWFIKNVVPHIDIKVKVAGTCCNSIEPLSDDLKNRVELLGLVDDLSTLYRDASMVIAPIFKGSGMKTKTIEAMSYGKTIIGTTECFQGIDCDYSKIGALCNTADEFISAINDYKGGLINDYTLKLFADEYSNKAVKQKFIEIFE